MTTRLRSVLAWSALAVLVAGRATAFALSSMRARARAQIYAKLRAYEAAGEPLSRDALIAAGPMDAAIESVLDGFLGQNRFDPLQWEPTEGSGDVEVDPTGR